jgi:hypothetical protein
MLMVSNPKGIKQLRTMKSDFCTSTPDLVDLCLSCGDQKRLQFGCYPGEDSIDSI